MGTVTPKRAPVPYLGLGLYGFGPCGLGPYGLRPCGSAPMGHERRMPRRQIEEEFGRGGGPRIWDLIDESLGGEIEKGFGARRATDLGLDQRIPQGPKSNRDSAGHGL